MSILFSKAIVIMTTDFINLTVLLWGGPLLPLKFISQHIFIVQKSNFDLSVQKQGNHLQMFELFGSWTYLPLVAITPLYFLVYHPYSCIVFIPIVAFCTLKNLPNLRPVYSVVFGTSCTYRNHWHMHTSLCIIVIGHIQHVITLQNSAFGHVKSKAICSLECSFRSINP